jgi:mitogen-activated protein kinase 1/3
MAARAEPTWDFALPARYEPRKRVGKGSFGVLIAAHDRARGEAVAIKKVSVGGALGVDRSELKSLLREVRLLSHFAHDNIVRLRDVLLPAADAPLREVYLVQDLMDTDLHYLIQSAARGRQALTDDHVQYFLYQLLRGLFACHSANVLHRDLCAPTARPSRQPMPHGRAHRAAHRSTARLTRTPWCVAPRAASRPTC